MHLTFHEDGSKIAFTLKNAGDIEMVHVETIYSDHLKDERRIYIMTPPGYDDDPERTYPVLYMQDGQNIFSEHREGPLCWDVDTTAQSMMADGKIEEIIVVGIANSEWRDDEYTPTVDDKEGTGGYADLYLHFLIEEVKGFIDSNYRVRPFREDTGIVGSSLGGLLSLYAAITYPDFFGKIGVISPSLWWDNEIILQMAKEWNMNPEEMKIWIDMGMREADEEEEEEEEEEESTAEQEEDEEEDDDEDKAESEEDLSALGYEVDGEESAEDAEEDPEEDAEEDDSDDDQAEDAEEDTDDADPLQEARELIAILQDKGFVSGKNLLYFEDYWGYHDEISWGNRFGMVLSFLYGTEE